VAVVSESIATKYYPRGQAIGRNLTIGIDSVGGPWQIVGIARDTKSGNPRDTDPVRMTYIPLAQIAPGLSDPAGKPTSAGSKPVPRQENQDCYANTVLLRTSGDPGKIIADLRAALTGINPNLPLVNIATIQEQVSNLIANDELISALTTLFSLLALLLSAIGLYGVISYNVVQRTTEIGVRMALGAQLRTVLWMILSESLILLGIGVVLGLPLAITATRSIRNQFFGISAIDPLTFVSAIAVVSGMIVLATLIPARRATRVDPVVALRYE
jgi:ABC-type antimicrobial peptide transport system permease subunit